MCSPSGSAYIMTTSGQSQQGPDLIEPAADMKFGGMERRPRGPQAHGGLKYCGPMGAFLNVHF